MYVLKSDKLCKINESNVISDENPNPHFYSLPELGFSNHYYVQLFICYKRLKEKHNNLFLGTLTLLKSIFERK